MSHSAELSRRMAKARISAIHAGNPHHYRFPRRETEESRRIPWESRPPLFPYGFNWMAVADAAIVVGAIVLALAVAVGAMP